MKANELKKLVENYKRNKKEFQIATSLDEWNEKIIGWVWGTSADSGGDHAVEVNFIRNNLYVTLRGSDQNWSVKEYVNEFYDILIENASIFYRVK